MKKKCTLPPRKKFFLGDFVSQEELRKLRALRAELAAAETPAAK